MAFLRGAKRPIEVLCKRMTSPLSSGHGYSTFSCRTSSISDLKSSSFTSNFANSKADFRMFVRGYAVDVSSSEQIALIKKLRQITLAPIKDVKLSLVGCNWDIEAAQKDLRKRGIILASKKSSRTAAEGMLALAQNDSKAAIIELNCETDFVARNDIFQYLALSLAKLALSADASQQVSGFIPFGPESLEDLKMNFDHPKLSGERTVQNAITEVAAMMGENIKLRRGFSVATLSPGIISTYLHASPQSGLGRIAGILSLEVADPNVKFDEIQRVGSELAMHVVASKPLFLNKELVSSDAVENEREILKSQAESSGKPKMAVEKMVEGRLKKYFEEVVFMEQKFVVNNHINVETVISNLSEELGSKVKIGNFLRVEVGEGIQRQEESGASEPLAQAA